MSDHDWPGDHDDGTHGYDHDDPVLPGAADVPGLDDGGDLWWHDDDPPAPVFDEADPLPDPEPEPSAAGSVAVGADPDAAADTGDEAGTPFPPVVDVGPLPEPVDGFPWIDTGSLGVAAAGPLPVPHEPVDPGELAAYAARDLPPAADPWAALAGSDDPATAALARWWAEHGH